jgi:hypothetical protein
MRIRALLVAATAETIEELVRPSIMSSQLAS